MSKTAHQSQSQSNDINVDWWGLRLSNNDVGRDSEQFVIEDGTGGLTKLCSRTYAAMNKRREDDAGLTASVVQALPHTDNSADGQSLPIGGTSTIEDLQNTADFLCVSHSATEISQYMLRNLKAFGKDSATVDRAIFTLAHQIDEDLKTGQILSRKQRDVVRQMNKSASLLMIATAESRLPCHRSASEQTISQDADRVNNLLHIVGNSGTNMRQLQEMADEILSE